MYSIICFDGELILRECEGMTDWFVVDRTNHNNDEWMEPDDERSRSLILSSRISDADIEGSKSEMIALAQAILNGKEFSAKRCAVSSSTEVDRVMMWSPRNSQVKAAVLKKPALDLANNIILELQ